MLVLIETSIRKLSIPSLTSQVEQVLMSSRKSDLKQLLSQGHNLSENASKKDMVMYLLSQKEWEKLPALADAVQKATRAIAKIQGRFAASLCTGKHTHHLFSHLSWIMEVFRSIFPIVSTEEAGEAGLAAQNLLMRNSQNGQMQADRGALCEQFSAINHSRLEPEMSRSSRVLVSTGSSLNYVICSSLLGSSDEFASQLCATIRMKAALYGNAVWFSKESRALFVPLNVKTRDIAIVCFNRHFPQGCDSCSKSQLLLSSLTPFTSLSQPLVWPQREMHQFERSSIPAFRPDLDPVLSFLQDLGFASW